MKPEEIVDAEVVEPEQSKPAVSRLEQILSPQSLQWMVACGGGFLILGFVIWLWSLSVFENPIILAASVGSVTLLAIAGGMSLVRFTRYQTAGRGLTLLGALAMPLNLWLYDAQGLVVLAEGGNLWIPAALMCVVYGLVARVLRDPMFVYTLVGGVVMTGMLFLADVDVNHFWALLPPVTFLVSVGWISIFAERLFPVEAGDFSRQKFGLAFHRSGLLVLAGGLLLLLGGQLAAVANVWVWGTSWPLIAINHGQKLWALAIIGASAVGFVWQYVQREKVWYAGLTVSLVVWGSFCLLDVLGIQPHLSYLAIGVGVLTIAGNLLAGLVGRREVEPKSRLWWELPTRAIGQASVAIVSGLSVLASGQFFAQFFIDGNILFFCHSGWTVVLQLLTTALALWATAWSDFKTRDATDGRRELWSLLLGVGSVLAIAATWSCGLALGWTEGQGFALPGLAFSVGTAIAIYLVQHPALRRGLQVVASVSMTTLLLGLLLGVEANVFSVVSPHAMWGMCLVAATFVYSLAATGRKIGIDRVLGCFSAMGAIAIGGDALGFDFSYSLVLAPVLLGTGMSVFSRLRDPKPVTESTAGDSQLSMAGNSLVLLGSMSGVSLAVNRWLVSHESGWLLAVLLVQLLCVAIVGVAAKLPAWRLTFRAVGVATIAALICVADGWAGLGGWHRAELCSLLAGVALLVFGHIAWSREQEQKDSGVTMGLLGGVLLTAIPLAVGLFCYRLGELHNPGWMLFHEIGVIMAGLMLFGSGMLCKIRSTTIAGVTLLAGYVVSLLMLVRWPDQLQSVSVVMMIGGGVFFGVALLMSIYRDRLASLPRRVREGEGVYRVLKWR